MKSNETYFRTRTNSLNQNFPSFNFKGSFIFPASASLNSTLHRPRYQRMNPAKIAFTPLNEFEFNLDDFGSSVLGFLDDSLEVLDREGDVLDAVSVANQMRPHLRVVRLISRLEHEVDLQNHPVTSCYSNFDLCLALGFIAAFRRRFSWLIRGIWTFWKIVVKVLATFQ